MRSKQQRNLLSLPSFFFEQHETFAALLEKLKQAVEAKRTNVGSEMRK